MLVVLSKWRRLAPILSMCLAVVYPPLRADEPVPLDPNHPALMPLKWVKQLAEPANPYTWLVGSVVVSLKSYAMFKRGLEDAKISRDAARKELERLNLRQAELEEAIIAFSAVEKLWNKMELDAAEAIRDIDREFKKYEAIPEADRKAWLENDEGKAWAVNFKKKNELLQRDLIGPYLSVIDIGQLFFPEELPRVEPLRERSEMTPDEIANSRNLDLHHKRLYRMVPHVRLLKDRCNFEVFDGRRNVGIAKASAARRHLGWRANVGGAGLVAGVAGAISSYVIIGRRYGGDPIQASTEQMRQNQTKLQAEFDLSYEVGSPKGQEKLAEVRSTFLAVVHDNREALSKALKERATKEDIESLKSQRKTPDDLIRFLSEPEHLNFAFEKSICVVGKRSDRRGQKAMLDQILNDLYPTNPAIRDLERPEFISDIYFQFFNTLWAPLRATGGGIYRIPVDLLRKIEMETIRRLDAKKITPPSPTPAPGLHSKNDKLKSALGVVKEKSRNAQIGETEKFGFALNQPPPTPAATTVLEN